MVGFMFFTSSFFFIFFFFWEAPNSIYWSVYFNIYVYGGCYKIYNHIYYNPLRKRNVIKYLCPTIQLFILHYFVIKFSYNLQVVF